MVGTVAAPVCHCLWKGWQAGLALALAFLSVLLTADSRDRCRTHFKLHTLHPAADIMLAPIADALRGALEDTAAQRPGFKPAVYFAMQARRGGARLCACAFAPRCSHDAGPACGLPTSPS